MTNCGPLQPDLFCMISFAPLHSIHICPGKCLYRSELDFTNFNDFTYLLGFFVLFIYLGFFLAHSETKAIAWAFFL